MIEGEGASIRLLSRHPSKRAGRCRLLSTVSAACFAFLLVLLAGAQIAPAAPTGQIAEFSAGLNPGSAPEGIAPGPDGNLWFTDFGTTAAIGRITTSGAIAEFSAGLNAGSAPDGIAPGPDGNLWFADQGATPAIGRITPAGAITEFSAGLNAGSVPLGIAPGPDGNLWFADFGAAGAIGRISPTGTITEFSAGLNPGSHPFGIAPGPDGNLWFTDVGTTKAVGRITPDGTIDEFTAGLNAGSAPLGIAPGPDGNLWFTDFGTTRAIGRITPTGTIAEFSAGLNAGSHPFGVAPGSDGNLWFTDLGTTPAIGRITPTGTIAEFSAGLNAGSIPSFIAPGADGNLWFADGGSTAAIGRAGAGALPPSLGAPRVTGSGEQGTRQTCQGDRWASWAGEQPARNAPTFNPPGYQWLRDGAPLAGQASRTYTPLPGDVGHTLACTVAVTYPLLNVTVSATADGVNVIPQNTGPAGAQGSIGPQGAAGPQGPPGRDATITCKAKGTKKVKCKVTFASAAGVRRARLSRGGVTYAEGKPVSSGETLALAFRTSKQLAPGRYTLSVVQHLDGHRVVSKSPVRVG